MEHDTEDLDDPNNNEFNQEQYLNQPGYYDGENFSRQTLMAHPVQILPEGYYYTYYVPFQPCNCLDCPMPPPTNEQFYETRFAYANPPNMVPQLNPYNFYGPQHYSQQQFMNGYPQYSYPTQMGHPAPYYSQHTQFPYDASNEHQACDESEKNDVDSKKSKEYIVEEPLSDKEDESSDEEEKESVDLPTKVPEKKKN